jgi:hypothetical protein
MVHQMTENSSSEIEPKSIKPVVELLRTRDIPRLEAMLAEQKASGALKKDIAETQKWLNSAKRHYKGLQRWLT